MHASNVKPTSNKLAEHVAAKYADKTIALVGLMGVGKSTIGRSIAPILGRKFVDSDHEIETAARLSVSEIFEQLGEAEFRRGEQAVIKRLLNEPPLVLATGGGAYLAEETRALLAERAVTVWLDADLKTLWNRVSKRDTRPLLKQDNARDVLENLKLSRQPTYAKADIVVTSRDNSIDFAVENVLQALANFTK